MHNRDTCVGRLTPSRPGVCSLQVDLKTRTFRCVSLHLETPFTSNSSSLVSSFDSSLLFVLIQLQVDRIKHVYGSKPQYFYSMILLILFFVLVSESCVPVFSIRTASYFGLTF